MYLLIISNLKSGTLERNYDNNGESIEINSFSVFSIILLNIPTLYEMKNNFVDYDIM